MAQLLRVPVALAEDLDSALTQWSQPCIILALGDPMPSSDPEGHQSCMWYTGIYEGKDPYA